MLSGFLVGHLDAGIQQGQGGGVAWSRIPIVAQSIGETVFVHEHEVGGITIADEVSLPQT